MLDSVWVAASGFSRSPKRLPFDSLRGQRLLPSACAAGEFSFPDSNSISISVHPLFNFAPDVLVAFSQTEINERIQDRFAGCVSTVVVVELFAVICSERNPNSDDAIAFSHALVWPRLP